MLGEQLWFDQGGLEQLFDGLKCLEEEGAPGVFRDDANDLGEAEARARADCFGREGFSAESLESPPIAMCQGKRELLY